MLQFGECPSRVAHEDGIFDVHAHDVLFDVLVEFPRALLGIGRLPDPPVSADRVARIEYQAEIG